LMPLYGRNHEHRHLPEFAAHPLALERQQNPSFRQCIGAAD
jgi:hypothetical protein